MDNLIFILIIVALIVWIVFLQKKIKKLERDLELAVKEKEEIEELGRGLSEYNRAIQQKKEEQKARILAFLKDKERITNDEAQDILKVSDATATRYLEELEKEDKIIQQGSQKGVFYVLK